MTEKRKRFKCNSTLHTVLRFPCFLNSLSKSNLSGTVSPLLNAKFLIIVTFRPLCKEGLHIYLVILDNCQIKAQALGKK